MTSDHEKSVLIYLQILKLEKIMNLYFFGSNIIWGRYEIWHFHDWRFDNEHKNIHFEITKSSFFSNFISEQKNKVTLFSSTLKVVKTKLYLLSWSEFILVNYDIFVVSWRCWETPQKSQMTKSLCLPQMTSNKKMKAIYFL